MDCFGTDYPTPDGSCVRDYIQISDLIAAHVLALKHLRDGGESLTCNCGYGPRPLGAGDHRGGEAGCRASTFRSASPGAAPAIRPRSSPAATGVRAALGWQPRFADDVDAIVQQALDWEAPAAQPQGRGGVRPPSLALGATRM